MKKISVDQLIAIIGKEEADKFFLNLKWIKRQKRYKSSILKYTVFERLGRLEDLGNDEFEGDLNLTNLSPLVLQQLPKIKKLIGSFDCSYNKLTSLEGSPEEIDGNSLPLFYNTFNCSNNDLTTLEGSPKKVVGYFDCSNNKLTTLKGSPEFVDGDFYCYGNMLTNLDYIPKTITGKNFLAHRNPFHEDIGDYGNNIERTPDGKTYRLVEK